MPSAGAVVLTGVPPSFRRIDQLIGSPVTSHDARWKAVLVGCGWSSWLLRWSGWLVELLSFDSRQRSDMPPPACTARARCHRDASSAPVHHPWGGDLGSWDEVRSCPSALDPRSGGPG